VNFEWDEKKNLDNIKKHKVSFENAARVFTDTLRKEAYDIGHSDSGEDRVIAIGISEGKLLFVSFSEPDTATIRIISARKAKSHERRYYYGDS